MQVCYCSVALLCADGDLVASSWYGGFTVQVCYCSVRPLCAGDGFAALTHVVSALGEAGKDASTHDVSAQRSISACTGKNMVEIIVQSDVCDSVRAC